ncbi:MAG: hypothetical protein MI924_08615, partial [Chloroflexales bacterium]|nr:hypothetical protein [Chloroflexales bacterium]
ADDYERSARSLPALFAARGEADEGLYIARILEREGTTARRALSKALEGFDAREYLRSNGLTIDEERALYDRLLGENIQE